MSAARAFSPRPRPTTMPQAIASTFLTAPPISAPIGSSDEIGPEGRRADRRDEPPAERRIGCRRASPRWAGRAPPRRRRSAPTAPPAGAPGKVSASTSLISAAVLISMPLVQMTTGVRGRERERRVVSGADRCCAGTREQHRVGARPPRRDRPVARTPGSSATPGRNTGFSCADVDRGHGLGLARPQHDLAPGARSDLRQRRAPGAAADECRCASCARAHAASTALQP